MAMENGIPMIERCRISGFKSIREADIKLGALNVVIGANGAGKSNLVSFFALLKASLEGSLNSHVNRFGGPNAFLHLGPKTSSEIKSALTLTTKFGRGTLYQRLEYQAPDALVFSLNHANLSSNRVRPNEFMIGAAASIILDNNNAIPDGLSHTYGSIHDHLSVSIGLYHFHDTTLTAPIRSACYIEDNRKLNAEGGNLAAFLYRLKMTNKGAYDRIVSTVRLCAPFFDDFSLAPRSLDPQRILLNWRQKNSDYEFGPHQLSDGTLRAMALIALLLQPKSELPKLIVVDEPEIGLHPYALNVLASLLKVASHHTQIIVATQSPQLLDECEPEDVICVDRRDQESVFSRQDPEKLKDWLEDYSLGEIWQKNVIGGGPH